MVKTIPNEKIFLSFLAYLNSFQLEMKPGWCFLIFKIFWEFSSSGRVNIVPNEEKILSFSVFPGPFRL